VEPAHVQPLEHRRRAEHLAYGHHAGAADARESDREVTLQGAEAGVRQCRHVDGLEPAARRSSAVAPARRADTDESRAVAADARVVEVARGLIDARLATERSLYGLHAEAVGLLATVAAPFTDPFVDHDPRGRCRRPAALAV